MRSHPQNIVAAGLLLALALSGAGCSRKNEALSAAPAEGDLPIRVTAAPPSVADWTVTVPISGTLQSQSIVDVRAEVGGRLSSMMFEEGGLVRRGELVAEVDPVNYRLALDQAVAAQGVTRAGVERARVAVEHARREAQRADNLLKSGGITEKDHEAAANGVKEAESQLALAQAQVVQAEAAVAVARKALEDCRILSPAEGHVQRKHFDRGTLISPGATLYTLVDNSRLELECLVPSYRLAEIRPGLKATFTTPTFGDRSFDGVVHAINPVVEADSRSVRVIVRTQNPRGELRSGMYARGDIVSGSARQVLVIPRSALVTDQESGDSGSVFVVREGKARKLRVRLGGSRLDRVWIEDGLGRDESVILEIGPALKDGSSVTVVGTPGQEG